MNQETTPRGKKKSALTKLKNRQKTIGECSTSSLTGDSDESDNYRGSSKPHHPIDFTASDFSSNNVYKGSHTSSQGQQKYQVSYPHPDTHEDSGTDEYRRVVNRSRVDHICANPYIKIYITYGPMTCDLFPDLV